MIGIEVFINHQLAFLALFERLSSVMAVINSHFDARLCID